MLELIAPLKPVLTALALPPASPVLLGVTGLLVLRRWPRRGRFMLWLALALLWFGACGITALWLQDRVLQVPAALDAPARERLQAGASSPEEIAIVVLGGGRHASLDALDGAGGLTEHALERLRHGVWLSRRTGWPLAYSGGIGWTQRGVDRMAEAGGSTEAAIADRIAREEFGLPLRWREDRSRDTRENAAASVRLLRAAGVRRIVLVTHAWHMPRALRAFQEADPDLPVSPAPVNPVRPEEWAVLDLLPSGTAARHVHLMLREWLGLQLGA